MNTDKIYAEHVAQEYSIKDASKVIALKKLDKRAKLPASIFTYTFGIFSSLVLGVGMCLSMEVIGPQTPAMFILGIIIGLLGFAGCGFNYPIYSKILEKSKRKYAADIIALANEITD
ncbi:MAG TPA: dihydropteridine reductase [Bacilli bacterium]|nr:dihydropteridine reductase [Bacilli bacterium]